MLDVLENRIGTGNAFWEKNYGGLSEKVDVTTSDLAALGAAVNQLQDSR
jgi:hypothetical protein